MSSTLYTARRVRTMRDDLPVASGVLVDGGRIVAVGDAGGLRERAARVVDFGEATITPGLVDGHTHPVWGCIRTAGVDLFGVLSLDLVRERLAAERDRVGRDGWVRAWGLNPAVFDGAEPSAASLGPAFSDGRSHVVLYDGHSAVASASVLEIAGIRGARPFASNARIGVDERGVPTGYLLEAEASSLVDDVLPVAGIAELTDRLDDLLRGMARTGLTGMHAMDAHYPTLEVIRALEDRGDLPVRIGLSPMLMPKDADAVDAFVQGTSLRGRRWRMDGIKFVVDGTVDGGTAWLEYPDTHGEGLDSLWRDMPRFREVVTRLHRAGVNVAVHAIGDRGVREVAGLFAGLRAEYGPLARHRIEHIETIPDDVVALFAGRAAAASMQPLHCTCFNNADRSDSWSQRLGDVRVDHGFRWADIRRAGGVLALGSDWPIAPYDPRWTMADAQLRRRFDRPGDEPMQPGEALTALQTLEGYTTHAALASGEERHRGRIDVGFDADLTVFGADPVEVDAETLGTIPIVATVVGGDVIEP